MKSTISVLTTLLVSVLGLTSCSPDPGEDSWRLHPPHISDGESTMKISAVHMESPSAAAELVFDEADLTDTTLTVTSSCRGGDDRAEESFLLRGVHRVPLASLWPSLLWKRLKASELEGVVCGLTFKASTRKGSTHAFKIDGLRLKGFASFDARSASRQKGETWTLLCDGFTSETGDEPEPESVSILALARRGTDTPKPLGHQHCRLFTKSEDEATGLPKNRLSRDFQLSFPNPLATSTVTTSFDMIGTPRASDTALVSVRLSNPGTYPIAYRVAAPMKISLQPLVRATRWDLIATTDRSLIAIRRLEERLALSISGEANRWSQDEYETFVIAPKSTATVSLELNSSLRCLMGQPDAHLPPYETYALNPPEIAKYELAGFYFGFAASIRLESIDYWSAAHPRDPSDSYTPVAISLPGIRQQPFHEGFQGIPEYVKHFDSTGRAPTRNVIVNENANTKWCKVR